MVVLSGTATMQAWGKVWRGAHVTSSPKGSVTTESLAEFFLIWCRHVRETVPLSEEVIVLLDSGGGGLIHISAEIGLLADKYRIRPYWLLPYLTKAVMPLDQKPNREYERRWSHIRSNSLDMGPLAALDAAHECWDAGYSPANIISGFRDAGIVHNEALQCEHLIQTRGPQLFKKLLSRDELQYETAEADQVFERPVGYRRASDFVTCDACSQKIQPSHKFCPHCKADNPKFSEVALAIAKGSKSQGYTLKGNNLTDLQDELAQIEPSRKANLSKVWGDLVSKTKVMAAPQASEVTSPAPEPPQPASSSGSAKKPEAIQTEENPKAVPEKGIESVVPADDLQEFDLDNPEHAERYILLHFSEKVREEAVLPVQYYIMEKKNLASKKEPLSHILQKELLQTNMLAKPAGRKQFLEAWKKNRAVRFVSKPHFAK